MSKTKSDTAKTPTTSETKATARATQLTEIQEKFDKEQNQGFRGAEVDPTPNENYTVAGVTKGLPTPETDAGAAKDARKVTGLGLSAIESAELEKK